MHELEHHTGDLIATRGQQILQLDERRAGPLRLVTVEKRKVVDGFAPWLPFAVIGTVGDLRHHDGAPMEAATKCDDLCRRRLALADDLQRDLVRFRAGIGDPTVTEPAAGIGEQQIEQPRTDGSHLQVALHRGILERGFERRTHEIGIGMTEKVHADAEREVEQRAPVGQSNPRAVAAARGEVGQKQVSTALR